MSLTCCDAVGLAYSYKFCAPDRFGLAWLRSEPGPELEWFLNFTSAKNERGNCSEIVPIVIVMATDRVNWWVMLRPEMLYCVLTLGLYTIVCCLWPMLSPLATAVPILVVINHHFQPADPKVRVWFHPGLASASCAVNDFTLGFCTWPPGLPCNYTSWLSRGWCRAELWCRRSAEQTMVELSNQWGYW